MRYRVGVIGLGYFSQFHLASWQAHSQVNLVGAFDIDSGQRNWAEKEFGVTTYEKLGALLDQNIDILDIVAPPMAHATLINQALGKARSIICQKPFCENIAEAESITKMASIHGTKLIIHENFRFQPWYRTIKVLLDQGVLGQIYAGRSTLRPGDGRGNDAYLARQPAFQNMQKFMIHETGVHFIDLFRWLFGPITSVYADVHRLNPAIKGEDTGILLMEHQGGIRSTLDGNRLSDHATDNPRRTMGEMEIEGEKGTLRLNGYGQITFRSFGAETWQNQTLQHPVDDSVFGGGCVAALNNHLISALNEGGPFENTAQDYLSVAHVELAAYKSAEQERKIHV